MKRTSFIPIFLAAALCSCTPGNVVNTQSGVKVRLEAVNGNIIRVQSVPEGAGFSDKPSLSVLPYSPAKADISRNDSLVVFKTSGITATVSRIDGRVNFYRPDGSLVLAENRREFTPCESDGVRAWTVRQVFESPEDEAFYGLGQHQADEWNYKGLNEELYQYNTKISVPFIVSTRGYGILWDSYCFCRWGDPRDYAQLGDVFTLYDRDGRSGSLTGTYTPRTGKPVVCAQSGINQEFLRTPQCDRVINSLEGFDYEGSSVLYEGYLEPAQSGTFRFLLYYAGYTKVFVDGKEVVPEIWRTAWNPNSRKFAVDLEAGQKVPLRIEWKPDGGVSYCSLKVLSPADPADQARQSWWGEMQEQIDYYFILGDRPDGVVSGYRTLTGKAQIAPKWAMGFWQSRERYRSQDEIVSTLREFRSRHIPVDNIVQDWQYWEDDQWGSHEFDSTRFPDPAAMTADIHGLGAHYMISVWPKFYTGTEHFREFDSNGWIYRTPVDENVVDFLGYPQSFYDAYSEGARRLFWEQMNEHLYKYGVDAWWMDASEPNIHDCTDMDYRKKMCGPTAFGPSSQYFNAYALVNAQAIYEGQRSVNPDARVFLLTRNGFSGLQRYSTASWSGDIGTRWEDMKTQISAGLNYSISGIPIWGQDIGGFSVEGRYYAAQQYFDRYGVENRDLREWRELQTRWYQFGAFVPLFRAHGQWPCREVWNIAPNGHRAYNSILYYMKLRYRLMPYIYTMAGRVHFADYTMMRPLVMDYPDDLAARGISDQYMFGDALLVCPVYTYGSRSREVYLPQDGWYNFYTERYCEGGRTITADAPYERIPLFVRAGQIIPFGPDQEWSSQDSSGSLEIRVYDGGDADYTLYEDDGVSYGYERGEFSTIDMEWDSSERRLTVLPRQGSFEGMSAERDLSVRLVSPTGTLVRKARYDGSRLEIVFTE